MEQDKIVKCAKELVGITIQKHKEELLGRERMSTFIKKNLTKDIKESDYDRVLHLYNKYLASEGYEIKKDISKFDIINYSSDEYQIYLKKLD